MGLINRLQPTPAIMTYMPDVSYKIDPEMLEEHVASSPTMSKENQHCQSNEHRSHTKGFLELETQNKIIITCVFFIGA